jgi:putative oxidoreductase
MILSVLRVLCGFGFDCLQKVMEFQGDFESRTPAGSFRVCLCGPLCPLRFVIFWFNLRNEEAIALRFLDRLQPLGLLALRLIVGVVMIAHGYGKVFHGGLAQHVHRVASLGIPGWLAYPSAFAEFVGGIFLIAGFLTRVFSLLILIDMAVAIGKVHWKNGMFGKGGYEFPLTLATIAFALILFGAGPIALDAILGKSRAPTKKT